MGHADVPARMARADVFVFPSLFEGSAVVTYEAIACGLPSIVTPEAGSVVRDGVEGFLVPAAGGPEERLTYHSAHDLPSCFGADGLSVLFTSTRQDAPLAALE